MSTAPLELIAAVAANGVIGRNGQLPWRLPDDLVHFKSLTMGHCIIMGRRTFESIGKALPGRTSVVISRSLGGPPAPACGLARSLDEAWELASGSPPPAFVIGGAVLYAAALGHVRRMHLTELDEPVIGDTFFPTIDRAEWLLTDQQRHDRDDRHPIGFNFCTYERVQADS